MNKNKEDTIRKVCNVLDIDDNTIITFEDFVELQFERPYEEVKNEPEIAILRKAWNKSCESLLTILDGISVIAERLNLKNEKRKKTNGE